jgi:hypothetical protein
VGDPGVARDLGIAVKLNRSVPTWSLLATLAIFGGLKIADLVRIRSLENLVRAQAGLIETLASVRAVGPAMTDDQKARALSILSSAQLDPLDGEAGWGIRIPHITPQGHFARLGAREGDVIRAVNGTRIVDAGTAADALEQLLKAHEPSIEVSQPDGNVRALKSAP